MIKIGAIVFSTLVLGLTLLPLWFLQCLPPIFIQNQQVAGWISTYAGLLTSVFTGLAWVAVFFTLLFQYHEAQRQKEASLRMLGAQEKSATILQMQVQLTALAAAYEANASFTKLVSHIPAQKEEVEQRRLEQQAIEEKRKIILKYLLELDPLR